MQLYKVLAPGPVNLHPEVQKILALPMIHHRTPEFDQILKSALTGLKKIFKTKQDCYILSSTGSGGMEALLVNTLAPGDQVLAIDSGKFGERWAEMAQVYGGEVIHMKIPWGQAVEPQDVENKLKTNPKIKLVLCQACETSSAVRHPIEALGKMIRAFPEVLFLVDGITALGAYPLPMDDWFIDGLVGGSQKAFMLPTGLSLLSFSEKAWKKIEKNPTPRFYFDIRKEKAANLKGETFFSSNVTLIRALDFVLKLIESEGLDKHFARIQTRSDFTLKFGERLGLSSFSKSPSPSLSALCVPAGIDSQELRLRLEKEHFITVMGGQDQAKGKILRIGHMGLITAQEMTELFLRIHETLTQMGAKLPIESNTLKTEMEKFWGQHG